MPTKRSTTQQADAPTDWNEVIAKALAYTVVQSAGLKDRKLTDQAIFLMGLGLSRKDAAAVLGSSDESLRVMLGRSGSKRVTAKRRKSRKG